MKEFRVLVLDDALQAAIAFERYRLTFALPPAALRSVREKLVRLEAELKTGEK
jgi:hypothetical protein